MRTRHVLGYFTVAFTAVFVPSVVFAHGEDKPGPHGGVIRMPGALHTEVVELTSDSVAVYLLDMNFEEPTVEDSSVKAVVSQDGKERELECKAEEDRFLCKVPSGTTLSHGSLVLEATRKGVRGVPTSYPLPCRL
jgi:hypothetical protein